MAELYTSEVPGVYSGLNITPKKGGSSKSSSGSMTGMPFGMFGTGTGTQTVTTPESEAKTKLSDLKAQYGSALDEGYNLSANALKKSYDDQTALLRADYDYSTGKLKTERDDALREQYIKGRQAAAALPEQLARYGINGGAVETTLANLMANYQSGRNATRNGYLGNLAELANGYQKSAAERAMAYNQNLADLKKEYLLNKANANDQYDQMWLQYLLNEASAENAYRREKGMSGWTNPRSSGFGGISFYGGQYVPPLYG